MKLVIVTLYDEFAKSYGELTSQGKERYCSRWGYDFAVWDTVFDQTISASWNKTIALLTAMDRFPTATHLFWSDADAMILDVHKPFDRFIDERFQMHVSNDDTGLNLGNFVIRNTKWSRELLLRLRDHARPGDKYHEQSALRHYLSSHPAQLAHIKHMGDAFNSYPTQPAGFMLHCAGRSHEQRLQILSQAQKRISWEWPAEK